MRYSDGILPVGPELASLPVVQLPDGHSLVKVRFRPEQLAVAFLRSPSGFSRWTLEFTDDSRTALKPWYCTGENVRPKSPKS